MDTRYFRYFHSYVDTYRAQLGYWKVTKREHQYLHTVQNSRRVFYRFSGHTHPYTELLTNTLIAKDIVGLEKLDTDVDLRRPYFTRQYGPALVVPQVDPQLCGSSAVALLAPTTNNPPLEDEGLPVDDLDFDYQSGAYSVYNWELFYHVPFTIAVNLSTNGRYVEAQTWFHYIFDPTDTSDPAQGPKRFWKVKPFKIDEVEHIESTLFNLATGDNPAERDDTVRAIGAWRNDPFRPHLIARTRPTAYMYATVMAYLDNLIAWGDSLFRQDTRESINEAMQLYVLAANILGPKPELIPSRGSAQKQTYASLKNRLDEFSNAAVDIEPEVAFDLFPAPPSAELKPEQASIESIGRSLYFCIPRNEKFLSYWDTVSDRLFKIRNSLNLQGVFRQLPLFAPPIDPAMLARAIAAGVDIGAIIDGSAGALLPVRSQFLVQKALEMAQEVKSLGSQILAALEKKDNETLGVLRATHEVTILGLAESVKYAQWQEAIKAREGIQVNLANVFQRFRHYHRLLGTDDAQIKLPDYAEFDRQGFESRGTTLNEPSVEAPDPEIIIGSSFRDGGHKVSNEEAHELDMLEAAQIAHDITAAIETVGAATNKVPDAELAAKFWGLGAGITIGGTNFGGFVAAMARVASGYAARISHEASMAGKMASYGRREQEWAEQRKSAAGELTLLYKQLRSAEIREYIAQSEHAHHLTQIKLSKDVLEFLTNESGTLKGNRRKTTTEDFYLWMKREAQSLHAKAFQFAFDIATKAEKAVQHELGDTDLHFVQNSYLAGREGLFAGEKLYLDLKRLEMAYAENYTREYEITKHVSLRAWFPLALIELRSSGHCQIDLPEALFDLDCPGHSFRRIKSVAVSIPCVVGPYASVNCALTLTESYVRRGTGGYGNNPRDDESNFTQYPAAVKSIVTSSSQADTGLFEANLRDERYLPFESAGVISSWAMELLGKPHSFDYDTISDLILTIRYTARTGGSRTSAEQSAEQWLKNNSACVFSMRHEFGTEWVAFKRSPAAADDVASLKFTLTKQHFPYRLEKMTEQAKQMHLFFSGNASGDAELLRNSSSLGTTQLVNGTAFDQIAFQPTGDFELKCSSNMFDDLWIVVDWAAAA
jgi:hypothetical protein